MSEIGSKIRTRATLVGGECSDLITAPSLCDAASLIFPATVLKGRGDKNAFAINLSIQSLHDLHF